MTSKFPIFVFLLALVLAPALCEGGLHSHHCAEHPEDSGCSQEESCQTDTCTDDPAPPGAGSGSRDLVAPLVVQPPVLHRLLPPGSPPAADRSVAPRPFNRKNLPCPASDLPLLI